MAKNSHTTMQDNNEHKDISVVILCYKAGKDVASFVEQMKASLTAHGLTFELVLVANYNRHEKDTDQTPSVVRKLAEQDQRIVVVAKEKEGMMGWDLRSGLAVSTGKTVALIDGDGQMPAEDVVRVYDALSSGDYDCAKTYRVQRDDGMERALISGSYNFILKALFPKVNVRDANAKPKIFTASALKKLHLTSSGWFIDAEMVIAGSYLGFRFVEVPTIFHENKFRRSFVSFRSNFEFFGNLIRYRLTRMHEFK